MIVEVQLFAATRELAGQDRLRLEVAEPATVGDLRAALARQCPRLERLLPHCLFAVNAEYAVDAAAVSAADHVACIPPVSGG